MSTPENLIGQEIITSSNSHRVDLGPKDRYADWSAIDLINKEIKIERQENIDLNRIIIDEAIIDDNHAKELGQSMTQERGQLSPIVVRARINEKDGQISYDIIDGFHRTKGRIKEGLTDVEAKVLYGCSDQEMYDLRILAVNSVKSIQFARLAEWMFESFETTDFAKKGMNVYHAFSIAANKSERTNNIKLSKNEIDQLRQWVDEKCKLWGKPLNTIYSDLAIVRMSSPSLVKNVRTADNGDQRMNFLTKNKLQIISQTFPSSENFGIQEVIAKYCIDHKLQIDGVQSVIDYLKENKCSNRMSLDKVLELISNAPIKEKAVKSKKNKDKPLIETKTESQKSKQEIAKKTQKYLASWTKNPEYQLTDAEKIVATILLYVPKSNIINYIKEKHPEININEIRSIAQSALDKKLQHDSARIS